MMAVGVTEARSRIYSLVDEVNEEHVPILITGKNKNAVLISEEDYRAICETLHLVEIPGMLESLLDGAKKPLEKCVPERNIES